MGELGVKYLYLFDENLAVKEGHEHEKLLYYWPSETDLQVKTKVGLCDVGSLCSL
mgnify:CR=1 FL=1